MLQRPVELAQYSAAAFAEVCRRHGIRRSMGRVGSSYDCQNESEARAAMLMLQVLTSGDGVGPEQALALAGRIPRRLPEE